MTSLQWATSKPIPTLPGYRATSDGTVWSSRCCGVGPGNWRAALCPEEWKQICGSINKGYLRAEFQLNGQPTRRHLHQVICEAFHGLRPGLNPFWQAAHKNGDHFDNRPVNLYWATAKENMADQYRHGTRVSKLTEEHVREILQSTDGPTKLAVRFGVSVPTVCNIRAGRKWKRLKGIQQ